MQTALLPTTATHHPQRLPAPPTFATTTPPQRRRRRLHKASTLIASPTRRDTATPAVHTPDLTNLPSQTVRPAHLALEVTIASGAHPAVLALPTPASLRVIPKKTRRTWPLQSVYSAARTARPRVSPRHCTPIFLLSHHFRPNTRARPSQVCQPACHTRMLKMT